MCQFFFFLFFFFERCARVSNVRWEEKSKDSWCSEDTLACRIEGDTRLSRKGLPVLAPLLPRGSCVDCLRARGRKARCRPRPLPGPSPAEPPPAFRPRRLAVAWRRGGGRARRRRTAAVDAPLLIIKIKAFSASSVSEFLEFQNLEWTNSEISSSSGF